MSIITVEEVVAETECGKTMYGGTVFLDGKFVKFIPISTESKKQNDKYLNHLRNNLSHRKIGNDTWDEIIYTCPINKGNYKSYWDNVPSV